ncbi:MAG: hypothetical protein QOK29_1751 [Rhodospirillaceae bacterium]|jgi:hypothetical protein|nr:hypothetical protein [Rhodospirillaceae bacterium]
MEKAINSEELRQIVGLLEDDVASAIIATGATVEEVTEAYAWLTMDDPLGKDLHHGCHGRAAVVCDLLAAAIEDPEDERMEDPEDEQPLIDDERR